MTSYGKNKNSGITAFNSPGKKTNGNDWLLILEKN
jgi:hypothetical protein